MLAFATVNGTNIYFDSPFNVYSQYVNGENIWMTNMINDIKKAFSEGYLINLLISVGGENNTFKPNGA